MSTDTTTRTERLLAEARARVAECAADARTGKPGRSVGYSTIEFLLPVAGKTRGRILAHAKLFIFAAVVAAAALAVPTASIVGATISTSLAIGVLVGSLTCLVTAFCVAMAQEKVTRETTQTDTHYALRCAIQALRSAEATTQSPLAQVLLRPLRDLYVDIVKVVLVIEELSQARSEVSEGDLAEPESVLALRWAVHDERLAQARTELAELTAVALASLWGIRAADTTPVPAVPSSEAPSSAARDATTLLSAALA